jgi:hypothetical protein
MAIPWVCGGLTVPWEWRWSGNSLGVAGYGNSLGVAGVWQFLGSGGGLAIPIRKGAGYQMLHRASDLARDGDQWLAPVNTVINFRVPQKVGNFLTSRVTVSFCRVTLLHGVIMYATFFLNWILRAKVFEFTLVAKFAGSASGREDITSKCKLCVSRLNIVTLSVIDICHYVQIRLCCEYPKMVSLYEHKFCTPVHFFK